MTAERMASSVPSVHDEVVTFETVPNTGDLVIEHVDFDDLEGAASSLPHVDEFKAENGITTVPYSKKKLFYALGSAGAILLIIIVAVATSGNKNKAAMEESFHPMPRTRVIEQCLFENQVSTLPQLQETGSSHHQATAFIADADALQLQTSAEEAPRLIERYVLALIYYHFGGNTWNYDLKFLSAIDHCDWNENFTTASGKIIRQGVFCNSDGFVTTLDLSWNNLAGEGMPAEIARLQKLETLHLYNNNIGGDFPSTFRGMKNLKSIALMNTGLMGTIPAWIGDMSQLTSLALGDNKMRGDIPASVAKLEALTVLGLDGNRFTGNIDMLKQLSNLQAIYLDTNMLTGDIEDANWPVLVELDVSNNMVGGTVPSELFNHDTLQVLDLHGNLFSGIFPGHIFDNDVLQFVALSHNHITGTISDRIGFLKNLMHLDVSFNDFTGVLPDTVLQLTNLHFLASSGNDFVPKALLNLSPLTKLRELAMKDNNIVGSIPAWIADLSSLELFDLHANGLTGSIPSEIANLKSLNHLLLNRNELTGSIPSEFENMSSLKVILIDSNSITGNANAICESSSSAKPVHFVADCYPGNNGETPEVQCRCCTLCCADNDPACNDHKWTSTFDPSYEYGFMRQSYRFNLQNAPAGYADASEITDPTTLDGGLRL